MMAEGICFPSPVVNAPFAKGHVSSPERAGFMRSYLPFCLPKPALLQTQGAAMVGWKWYRCLLMPVFYGIICNLPAGCRAFLLQLSVRGDSRRAAARASGWGASGGQTKPSGWVRTAFLEHFLVIPLFLSYLCRFITYHIKKTKKKPMEYNFKEIEKKWQHRWVADKTYRVDEDSKKEKFYVLNMFPYPSGAGLHVGHPLGYIASDIYARYKRLKGFNVLNPMGYDAYGLPAEQYAIQTGQHPAVTTGENIDRYRRQLDNIGFCFDWSREIRTCDASYYHWTQWAFVRMFNSYYCRQAGQARPIEELEEVFAKQGTE